MSDARRWAPRRWGTRLARLFHDLEALPNWHAFKVDFVEWAEYGTLYERPRQSARQHAARLREESAGGRSARTP